MRFFLFFITTMLIVACSRTYQVFPKKIENKKLLLLAIEKSSVSPDSKAYIRIEGDHFKAFSGCNDFNGTFEVNDEDLVFKVKDIDTNVCRYLPIQHSFLEHLVYTRKIIIKGNKVYFKNRDKTLLIFKK